MIIMMTIKKKKIMMKMMASNERPMMIRVIRMRWRHC